MYYLIRLTSHHAIIYYEYNGVVVTRIDKDAESDFYYGKCDDENKPCSDSYLKAVYPGRDAGMGGYLVFKSDKKVELIRSWGALYKEIGKNPNLKEFEFKENYQYINWHDSIKNNYGNVIEIDDCIAAEKEENKRNNSKIKATY